MKPKYTFWSNNALKIETHKSYKQNQLDLIAKDVHEHMSHLGFDQYDYSRWHWFPVTGVYLIKFNSDEALFRAKMLFA